MKNNAKAILICGKIASGKSTYAEQLKRSNPAVVLSCDEITLALFDGNLGNKHDDIAARTQKYLFEKSLEIIEAGANVILEWGFWARADRINARSFYESRGIKCEMHYVDVSDEHWTLNLNERNQKVIEGKTSAYYVDDGLMKKLNAIFEAPERDEIDVWHVNSRG